MFEHETLLLMDMVYIVIRYDGHFETEMLLFILLLFLGHMTWTTPLHLLLKLETELNDKFFFFQIGLCVIKAVKLFVRLTF